MGYFIKCDSFSREEIIDRFNRISEALECEEHYQFAFRTSELNQAKKLISELDNQAEIEISVQSDSLKLIDNNYSCFYDFLREDSLQLVNLSLIVSDNEEADQFYTMATLIKRNSKVEVGLNGAAYLPKNKKNHKQFYSHYANIYNSCFEFLNLKTRALVTVSTGIDSSWKMGKKGIGIVRDEGDLNSEINFSKYYCDHGCHLLDFYSTNEENRIHAMTKLFDFISRSPFFSTAKPTYRIWGKASTIISIIEKNNLDFAEVSNIVSREIKTTKSLFKAYNTIEEFNGFLEMKRPYSFQNSLSDSLGLYLHNNELNINLRAGMTSNTTIEKFKKMLKSKLNEEIELIRTNLF
jgi:hypothetical protein